MNSFNKQSLKIPVLMFYFIFFTISTVSLSLAATPEPPSTPSDYVVDLADIIRDDVEIKLNSYLKELEEKTTAQVVILTIKSLDEESIEDFSLRIAERWRLGQKGKDNGLLITIALEDRKYRFEVGYGLEEILPDSLVGSIGREYLMPYFRQGDYTTGIFKATIEVIRIISRNTVIQTEEPQDNKNRALLDELLEFAVLILFIIMLICTIINHVFSFRKIRHKNLWLGGFGGPAFGGFGGGFGGFSGGGGSFGGGGASGNW